MSRTGRARIVIAWNASSFVRGGRLAVERLEAKLPLTVGPGDSAADGLVDGLVLGADRGWQSTPLVRVLDAETGAVRRQFLAYERRFNGGVRVCAGDVTGDGVDEILTAPGAGRVGEIRVFTQAGIELQRYRTRPFGSGFTGGVELTVGAVTGAGRIELVAGQASGGNLVRVFTITSDAADPVANAHTRQFLPFGPKVRSGARLATADLGSFEDGVLVSAERDGVHEIVAGSGVGARGTVTIIQAVAPDPVPIDSFRPLAADSRGGVFVARLPGGPTVDRILVSGGKGSGSQVETWRHEATGSDGFIREASFVAFGDGGSAVVAAAFDETTIFSVENLGSTGKGVRRNTAPGGGMQTTVPTTAGGVPSLRLAVARLRPADGSVRLTTNFTVGDGGWKPGVVDLPSVPHADYDLDSGLRELPAEVGSGKGFMLQGMNRSDDLFLYVTRQLGVADGILPDTSYELAFTITLASNAPTGGVGAGGSPGESVWLKAGGSAAEPIPIVDAENWLRLNVDKGNQSQGGTAASVAGTIGNGREPTGGADSTYISIVRQVTHSTTVTSDAQGRIWLLTGIDSGFEGFTRIYLQQIIVQLTRR